MKFILSIVLTLAFWCTNGQNSTASKQVTTFSIDAPQLKTSTKIWVYLPTNYQTSTKKFPVMYMQEGQNLFDNKTATNGEWNVDEVLDSINAQVIIIGIESNNKNELIPFKNETYGDGNADNYLDFIVNTLKPFVDKTYRTKVNAHNTALFGSSLGGLVSFYGALKYPKIFGKVGCFSPSFFINRKEISDLMEKTSDFKTKIYFLASDNKGDETMIKDINSIEYLINTKRCECKMLNKKVIAKDGQDNEKLWRAGFKKAYLWLF